MHYVHYHTRHDYSKYLRHACSFETPAGPGLAASTTTGPRIGEVTGPTRGSATGGFTELYPTSSATAVAVFSAAFTHALFRATDEYTERRRTGPSTALAIAIAGLTWAVGLA